MKLLLQILFLLLTWFSNVNATSLFTKVELPNYELSFSKTINVKEEKEVKTDSFLIAWDAFYAAADIVATLPNGAIKININASITKPSFKQKFTEFIQTSKNFANVSTIKTQLFINAFCRAVAQKRLIESATALKNNFALTVKPNMVAVVASANTEYNIATCNYLDYLNDVEYLFAPGKTVYTNAAQVAGYEKLVKLENVTFYTPNGKAKFGNFEVYKNTLTNEIVILDLVVQGAGDELANAFKSGFTKESILAIPKGSRPSPSTYLKEEYIASHLNKFESEGTVSRIVSKNDYNTYGVGKPDAGKTEFVGLKSEIDNILSLPINEQAAKLGIPIEQLQNGNLVRIDFKLSSTYKIQMPSGNEFGANPQWMPGGRLPTGLNEAIIKTEGMQLNVNYFVKDL